jgi:hypothetical protein
VKPRFKLQVSFWDIQEQENCADYLRQIARKIEAGWENGATPNTAWQIVDMWPDGMSKRRDK